MNDSPTLGPVQSVADNASRSKLIVSLVLLVTILIAGAAVYTVRIDGDRVWQRVFAASSLRDMTISAGSADDSLSAYRFSVFGIKQIRGSETVLMQAKAGKHKAAIVRTESGEYEVRLLAPEQMVLAGGAFPKGALALSKSGRYIAYAVATNPDVSRGAISAWTLYVYDLQTRISTEVGNGYGPQFFERDGTEYVLYTTTEGIAFSNLADNSGFVTPLRIPDETVFAARISDTGMYLAYRDRARRAWNLYDVKKLAPGIPLSLSPVAIDISSLDSVRFDGEELVGVLPTWVRTEEGRERSAQHVVRLSPGQTALTTVYGLPTDLTVRFE